MHVSSARWWSLALPLVAAACGGTIGLDDGGSGGGAAMGGGTATGGGSAGTGGGVITMPTGDLPCDVSAVVSNKCITCHSSPPRNGAAFPLLGRADFLADSPTHAGTSVGARSVARLTDAVSPMPPTYAEPTTAAERTALTSWVNAGMPTGSCQTMQVPDAGPPMVVCTSNSSWSQGNRESPNMNPGLACRACHLSLAQSKVYAFMGTVYPSLHERDLCNSNALPSGTVVEILDMAGTVRQTLTPTGAGNFYSGRSAGFSGPYTARVRANGKVNVMTTAQTDGDCNSCHTELGANNAPGRITVPQP